MGNICNLVIVNEFINQLVTGRGHQHVYNDMCYHFQKVGGKSTARPKLSAQIQWHVLSVRGSGASLSRPRRQHRAGD